MSRGASRRAPARATRRSERLLSLPRRRSSRQSLFPVVLRASSLLPLPVFAPEFERERVGRLGLPVHPVHAGPLGEVPAHLPARAVDALAVRVQALQQPPRVRREPLGARGLVVPRHVQRPLPAVDVCESVRPRIHRDASHGAALRLAERFGAGVFLASLCKGRPRRALEPDGPVSVEVDAGGGFARALRVAALDASARRRHLDRDERHDAPARQRLRPLGDGGGAGDGPGGGEVVRGRVQGEGFGEGGARFWPGVELVGFPDEDAREPQREFARDELARVLAEDEEEARLAFVGDGRVGDRGDAHRPDPLGGGGGGGGGGVGGARLRDEVPAHERGVRVR